VPSVTLATGFHAQFKKFEFRVSDLGSGEPTENVQELPAPRLPTGHRGKAFLDSLRPNAMLRADLRG
jgi:hypothetical protein